MTPHKIVVLAIGLGLATPALAEEVTFTLANQTGTELTEFYASPVGNDNWEENMLASGGLAAGASGQVTISKASGCDYDLRMVFADGDVLQDNADICTIGTYSVQ